MTIKKLGFFIYDRVDGCYALQGERKPSFCFSSSISLALIEMVTSIYGVCMFRKMEVVTFGAWRISVIASINNLKGFSESIQSVFPDTVVLCRAPDP